VTPSRAPRGLVALVVALVPVTAGRWPIGLVGGLATVLAVGSAAAVAIERAELTPGPTGVVERATTVGRDDYVGIVVPQLQAARREISPVILTLDNLPTAGQRAALIRSEILPALRSLQQRAESLPVEPGPVEDAHAFARRGLEASTTGFDLIASGLETEDADVIDNGKRYLSAEVEEWERWLAAVDRL
jgi:hypothetical protein